jgi:hypothetical protein
VKTVALLSWPFNNNYWLLLERAAFGGRVQDGLFAFHGGWPHFRLGVINLMWCYSGVTVVLQWCYNVYRMLQCCYSGVTVVYSGVTHEHGGDMTAEYVRQTNTPTHIHMHTRAHVRTYRERRQVGGLRFEGCACKGKG